jgi:hypothetical protein
VGGELLAVTWRTADYVAGVVTNGSIYLDLRS